MSKWLSVVALVLLVLCGAMGLRNLTVANAATVSALNSSSPAIWSNGPGPIPPFRGGHEITNGPGPIPPFHGGRAIANGPGPIPPFRGGHEITNGPGPIPPFHGGHAIANGPGPIPPFRTGGR